MPDSSEQILNGECGECGAVGPVHDFFGDLVCTVCRAKDEELQAASDPDRAEEFGCM
jgi:hypothetical protein